MALLNVKVGGKSFIIDCANKGSAKAWGRTKIEVEVSEASGDDVTAFIGDGGSIEKVVPAAKAEAAEAVETAVE
jgi:transcription antitermination factor NusA-like protein